MRNGNQKKKVVSDQANERKIKTECLQTAMPLRKEPVCTPETQKSFGPKKK